jgi:GntR family transcriptional regulator, transcriptional repressor for pyruvate dehydrogenase complex
MTLKRNGLVDQVIDRVRGLVADRTYRVGDRLPAEADLCTLFGVGRSTIREAMRVLANRGLIDIRHGEGTFVAARSMRESLEERLGRAALADIYEARLYLELPLAELAAQRRSTRDIAAMRKSLKARSQAIRAGDVGRYGEADFEFHLAVARAAKNTALFELYQSFVHTVRPLLGTTVTPEYLRTEHDTLHDALCEAIAAGDSAETRRLVRAHLKRSLHDIAKGLD